MRPFGLGLIAALVVAVLAPAAVMSASPKPADIPAGARKQGMAEAPPLVLAASLPCTVSDARFIGKSPEDKKTGKPVQNFYEVACGPTEMGYVLQTSVGVPTTAFSCVEANTPAEAGKPAALPCLLPGNADPRVPLAAALTKANIKCVPEAARGIGQSKTNTYLEVACQDGSGYVAVGTAPLDLTKKFDAQNCLNFDDGSGNIKCVLGDHAKRLAIMDQYVTAANNGCAIKDRRFVGAIADGSNFYEASCQDGKGYIYRVSAAGALGATYECAKASGILGGCTLTDAREAETAQAGLYTKLAKAAGSSCQVSKYGVFPAPQGQDVVELVCADGSGGVGIFNANGAGQVLDCGHALVAGYKCGMTTSATNYAGLSADITKFQKSCNVNDARLAGKSAKGTIFVEVTCTDGLKGYEIEYTASPVTAVSVTGCAFLKDCKMKGNS